MKRQHISSLFILLTLILLTFPSNIFAWSPKSGQDSSTSASSGGGSPFWSNTTESDCRFCHEDLDRFPQLGGTNPDKHHLLMGSKIESPVIAPHASEGDTYECMSCHGLIWSETMSSYSVEAIRDCLQCHPANTVTGKLRSDNVHHQTETFYLYSCSTCHRGHR